MLIPLVKGKRRLRKPKIKLIKNIPYCLYIIHCQDKDHIYIGITSDPTRREKQHRTLRGACFTKNHGVKIFKVLVWLNNLNLAREIEEKYVRVLCDKNLNSIVAGGSLNLNG